MSGESVDFSAPGFYGKVPARGDFVARRLPREFVSSWDAWLQLSLEDLKVRYPDQWTSFYLKAPIWRFVLSEGICGDKRWLGVLMPSVDRVSRCFPLAIAVCVEHDCPPAGVFEDLGSWFDEIERLALDSLRGGHDVHDLDDALCRHIAGRTLKRGTLLDIDSCEAYFRDRGIPRDYLGDSESRVFSVWWVRDHTVVPVLSLGQLSSALLLRLMLA